MKVPHWFAALLEAHDKIAIGGGPKVGKTTLANASGRTVLSGDYFIPYGWSESSQILAERANAEAGPLVIEGVQVPRALRKGLRVDCLVWLSMPHEARTSAQDAMSRGCESVLREWLAGRELQPVEGAPGVSVLVVK